MTTSRDFLLLEGDDQNPELIQRLKLGDTSGKDEAWLRDTLLAHPQILPIADIDPAHGPLIPLCAELRCDAGRIDAVFINASGRLTLVECKLWRNPEARREVVAQTLDYASALSNWTYSDLQREVRVARKAEGNLPFDLVKRAHPELEEPAFIDAVSRNLREGRFLLIVAGDGIREDVERITSMVQRNAALGFAFALVEVALYGLANGNMLVQPRTIARTEVIERQFVLLGANITEREGEDLRLAEPEAPTEAASEDTGESPKQAAYRAWWQPVLDHPLDDPDQEKPELYWPNHIRAQLPWPGTWITCYRYGTRLGVGLAGRKEAPEELLRKLEPEIPTILEELPPGFEYRQLPRNGGMTLDCRKDGDELPDEDAKRDWFVKMLNALVNAIRPRTVQLSRRN